MKKHEIIELDTTYGSKHPLETLKYILHGKSGLLVSMVHIEKKHYHMITMACQYFNIWWAYEIQE